MMANGWLEHDDQNEINETNETNEMNEIKMTTLTLFDGEMTLLILHITSLTCWSFLKFKYSPAWQWFHRGLSWLCCECWAFNSGYRKHQHQWLFQSDDGLVSSIPTGSPFFILVYRLQSQESVPWYKIPVSSIKIVHHKCIWISHCGSRNHHVRLGLYRCKCLCVYFLKFLDERHLKGLLSNVSFFMSTLWFACISLSVMAEGLLRDFSWFSQVQR